MIVIAILVALAAIAGAVLPILPGPPLSFIALLIAKFSSLTDISNKSLLIYGIIVLAITIFDYFAPILVPKKFGASEMAIKLSICGMIIGLFVFPPFGIIIGPFVGALIGELIDNKNVVHAFKIAMISFFAFIFTTGLKLIISGLVLYKIIAGLF